MDLEQLCQIRGNVRILKPLVHSITNPISINQCANAVLAVGARPVMAEQPKEVKEITKTANSLMLNVGNITDARMKSIMISARIARDRNIPCIIDAVGVACSELRRNFVLNVLEKYTPSVIKGNYSEIKSLLDIYYKAKGVDCDNNLDIYSVEDALIKLSQKYNTTVLATGKTDMITDGRKIIYIKNGTEDLAEITGTGCMLGAILGSYLSVSDSLSAAISACVLLGICGELSKTDKGAGSFMVNILDKLSTITDEEIKECIRMEEKKIEKI